MVWWCRLAGLSWDAIWVDCVWSRVVAGDLRCGGSRGDSVVGGRRVGDAVMLFSLRMSLGAAVEWGRRGNARGGGAQWRHREGARLWWLEGEWGKS